MAFACAIALHEILAGLMPSFAPNSAPEVVQHVTIVRVEHRATPTPRPTPTPTPVPTHTLVAQVRTQGISAPREIVRHLGAARPKPPRIVNATPVPEPVSSGGQGAGEGNGAGAGSLGNGGNGNGAGTTGNGDGGGAVPCGEAQFEATGNAVLNPDTGYYERSGLIAIVRYSDGSTERVKLDWTWRYKSEADDPFSSDTAKMYFQTPPPDQRASEPPIVQYIIRYSLENGATKLYDCPNGTP